MRSWGKAHVRITSNKIKKFAFWMKMRFDNRGDIYAINQSWVKTNGTIGSGNDKFLTQLKSWLQSVVLQEHQQQQV